jgi:hypothetical protein
MQLYRIDELSPRMRPTPGMNHLRPADVVVGGITVGLLNAIELPEKLLRSFASTAEAKVPSRFFVARPSAHHRSWGQ